MEKVAKQLAGIADLFAAGKAYSVNGRPDGSEAMALCASMPKPAIAAFADSAIESRLELCRRKDYREALTQYE